ncbi:hypothetical protein BJ912DRAFT_511678 [Pholiota molesta]|nr:hypothetical protein BJ912DRAFT_511678 [Pholiota molesta]
MSQTLLECTWVGVLSVFQMSSAIGTLLGDAEGDCRLTSDRNVCVSASLLVPVSWINAVLFLTYFLALFVATMTHKSIYPNIWNRTIYSIQWFEHVPGLPSKEKMVQNFCGEQHSTTKPYLRPSTTMTSSPRHSPQYSLRDPADDPAPWAATPIRRGIDPPFASQPAQTSSRRDRTSPTTSVSATPTLTLPSLPDRRADPLVPSNGSRYVEKFRESSVLARSESPAQFTRHYHSRTNSTSLLSAFALDLDQPIPLTRMSEWVKAEDVAWKHRSQGSGLLFAP